MEFVNDPVVESLPLVGGDGVVLLAPRTLAGRAYLWEPSGDAEAFVALMGSGLRAVDGKVFQFDAVGNLTPVDTTRRQVVVVPPAGEPFLLEPDVVGRGWCEVKVSAVLAAAATDGSSVTVGQVVSAEGPGNDAPADAPAKKAAVKKAAVRKAGV